MGWVHVNLAEESFVSGMVISEDITNKIKYARKGIQHPEINELLRLIKHPEPVIKIIESLRKKLIAKEFDYSVSSEST
jgi:hypothetical protein